MGNGHLNLPFCEDVSHKLEKANIVANKGEQICMFFILHELKNKPKSNPGFWKASWYFLKASDLPQINVSDQNSYCKGEHVNFPVQ